MLLCVFFEAERNTVEATRPNVNVDLLAAEQPAKQHSFVVLADPQLGMKSQYTDAADWKAEQAMFVGLVKAALKKKPDFLFVAGDMQNHWPNEKDKNGKKIVGRSRGLNAHAPKQTDKVLMSGQLGVQQRASVREALRPAKKEKVPITYTPGNHDIGDVPDAETIATYKNEKQGWGPLWSSFTKTFTKSSILYVQFTSQFYWDHALMGTPSALDADTEKVKAEQSAYLEEQFRNMQGGVTRLVLLTHIPPFMDTADEKAGWANWKESDRDWILKLLESTASSKGVPVLWVCGHFHTNVEKQYTTKDSKGKKVTNDIIVTSSSGSTMWWDGANEDGHLSPSEAASVASKPVKDAFFQDIIQMGTPDKCPGPLACQWNDLIQPIASRSGLRIFSMKDDGGFTHEWKTLEEINRR